MDLLLLEDDDDLGRAVRDHLAAAGHRLHWCRRMADADTASPWDLALLDLHLSDGNGLDLLRRWRQAGLRQPVIVLTARDQVSDRIRGLQAGADDYLVKPFDLDELLARIDAVARRAAPPPATPGAPPPAGALRLDGAAHTLWRGDQRIDLTQMEWAVLDCLAQHPGRIYSRGEIEDRLHRQGLADASSNSLEVIVSRLRKKLGAAAISTHRGLGYRLEA
jgi:two-component system, OmpR family, response regulator